MGYTAEFIAGLPAEMRKEVAMLSAEVDKLKKERHEQGLALNVKKEEAALAKLHTDKEIAIKAAKEEADTIIKDAVLMAEDLIEKANKKSNAIFEVAEKKTMRANEEKETASEVLLKASATSDEAAARLKVAESKELALGIKQMNFEKRIKDAVDSLSKI